MKYNNTRITFTTLFEKQRKAAPLDIRKEFKEIFALFLEDPHHPALRRHFLNRKLAGYESIDITGDWRALFKEKNSGEQKNITFHMFGTHPELYSQAFKKSD